MTRNKRKQEIEGEVWAIIPDTQSKYEVSNFGRVRSYCQNSKDGKILKPSLIGGFEVVSLKCNEGAKHFLVHKLVAELFVEKIEGDESVVIHLDWNKRNNHFTNLMWHTKENSYKRMHERLQNERKKKGKVVTYSKLKTDEVALIKSMLQRGVKQKLIAKMFCVSEMQITRIKRGDNWQEVAAIDQESNANTEKKIKSN